MSSDIAIIGMNCILPGASELRLYWQNILHGKRSITEIPKNRWDWETYYDPNCTSGDKIKSKWGGFIDPVCFQPAEFGIPPKSLQHIEPLQMLTLKTVEAALLDAGYNRRPFDRERTSVIMGTLTTISDLGQKYVVRANLPMLLDKPQMNVFDWLPQWSDDSFPGTIINVVAGRVANCFNLGGVNYTVDAACASSLAALELAVNELEEATSDMVIVGGAETIQNPWAYLCFTSTNMLSPTGEMRPLDQDANGVVLGEGIGVVVLKRREDAEEDGDRIYALIRGIGGSSDGQSKVLTSPQADGQQIALERAYEKAGFGASTVDLIEMSGAATKMGDKAEIETFKRVFAQDSENSIFPCAIGSVKSMIGYTRAASGMAGLIKTALSLYHNVLPPALGVQTPNKALNNTRMYVNTEARPWICRPDGQPRRACVNAFGFGGCNFHAVLEEYTGDFLDQQKDFLVDNLEAELCIWPYNGFQQLINDLETVRKAIHQAANSEAAFSIKDLSYTLWQNCKNHTGKKAAIVASSLKDLQEKIGSLLGKIDSPAKDESLHVNDPSGIYLTEKPLKPQGKTAFVFSGQGSQYVNMFAQLAIHFKLVRDRFRISDKVLSKSFSAPLSRYIFPPSRFTEEEHRNDQLALMQTHVAQPAIAAVSMAGHFLLQKLGINPDVVAGHSSGEYAALCAAGAISEQTLYRLIGARGRFIQNLPEHESGTMLAINAEKDRVEALLVPVDQVWIANINSYSQTIVSGTHNAIEQFKQKCEQNGLRVFPLAVSNAFHSPIIAKAKDKLIDFLNTVEFNKPGIEIFSNTLAAPYPDELRKIVSLLGEHLVQPVNFIEEIEALYNAGARIFVEVGPRNVLTHFLKDILKDKQSCLVAALEENKKTGIIGLQHLLGRLIVNGVPLQLDNLYKGRNVCLLDLENLSKATTQKPHHSATAWLVDGAEAYPQKPTQTLFEKKSKGQESANIAMESGKNNTKHQSTSTPMESLKQKETPENNLPNRNDRDLDKVMFEFQRVMSQFMERFLDTQKQVMQTYLTGKISSEKPMGEPLPSDKNATEKIIEKVSYINDGVADTENNNHMLSEKTIGLENGDPHRDSPPVKKEQQQRSFSQEELTKRLVRIVSERTGYPEDMIGLEQDLDADLGIDSIKWVEILGTLQDTYLQVDNEQAQTIMGELTQIKTLKGIVDWLEENFSAPANEITQSHIDLPKTEDLLLYASENQLDMKSEAKLSRYILKALPLTLPSSHKPLIVPKDTTLLVTDDGKGFAQALANELGKSGYRVAIVRDGKKTKKGWKNWYATDFRDPRSIDALVSLLHKKEGKIAGFIHLLPLQNKPPLDQIDFDQWQRLISMEVKSLFYFAKALKKDLIETSRYGAGWFFSATGMGGNFAAGQKVEKSIFPGQGGIAGIVKSLALEWPTIRCKCMDLNLDNLSAMHVAKFVIQEMAGTGEEVEVGYDGAGRWTLALQAAPLLSTTAESELHINTNWVIALTGGARGITATIAKQLANKYKPTLLLVGSSPWPEEEPSETASLQEPEQLKNFLIKKARKLQKDVSPQIIEDTMNRTLRDREMKKNVQAMKDAGAQVHYYPVDVRDYNAFGSFIDGVYSEFGRLDGFIHGAGIIRDKLIENKSSEAFAAVFDTKADSAYILAEKLRSNSLKFLALFSSIAARLGNQGQTDYSAGNEVLNKMAVYLNRKWSARVFSMNWNPWSGVGMVLPHVQSQAEESGMQLITPSMGYLTLDEEIRYGNKRDVEIIIGDGFWSEKNISASLDNPVIFPLLGNAALNRSSQDSIETSVIIDPIRDGYLRDHQIDGKPVLPFVAVMELMAELAQTGWPEFAFQEIISMRRFRGIIFDQEPKKLYVRARLHEGISASTETIKAMVNISDEKYGEQPSYQAIVGLGKKFSAPPVHDPGLLSGLNPFPVNVDEAYKGWLFHGPCLQKISEILGFDQNGIAGMVRPSSPKSCVHDGVEGMWLIDPALVDSGLQLAVLWLRAHYDMVPLISAIGSYQRFTTTTDEPLQCRVHAKTSAGGHMVNADFYFIDSRDRVVIMIENLEGSGSKELLRITDS